MTGRCVLQPPYLVFIFAVGAQVRFCQEVSNGDGSHHQCPSSEQDSGYLRQRLHEHCAGLLQLKVGQACMESVVMHNATGGKWGGGCNRGLQQGGLQRPREGGTAHPATCLKVNSTAVTSCLTQQMPEPPVSGIARVK